MSKDLSSSIQEEESKAPKKAHIGKAILTIVTVLFSFLAAQFIGIVLFVSALSAFGKNTDQIQSLLTDNAWAQFGAILIIEILTVGLVYFYLKITKRNVISYLKLRKPPMNIFGITGLFYVAYFVAFIILATLASRLAPALDTEQMQQIGFENTNGIDYIAVFIALAVLPPIAEEIVFRGVLFQKLKQYTALIPAAIATSVLFGIAHLEFFSDASLNWIAALDTFIFSFFLIGLYVKTKSLWAPILLHALKNSVAFTFLFLL